MRTSEKRVTLPLTVTSKLPPSAVSVVGAPVMLGRGLGDHRPVAVDVDEVAVAARGNVARGVAIVADVAARFEQLADVVHDGDIVLAGLVVAARPGGADRAVAAEADPLHVRRRA